MTIIGCRRCFMSPIGLPSNSRPRRSGSRPRRSILPNDRTQRIIERNIIAIQPRKSWPSSITWYENRLVPLCYDLVSVDVARAERMAATIHNPHLRAYAVGMIAKALAPTDKAKARKLILQAYDILAEASRNPDRRWPQLSWVVQPADHCRGVAAGCRGDRSDAGRRVHMAGGFFPPASAGRRLFGVAGAGNQ